MTLFVILLACLATLSPLASASPLWVVTGPRYVTPAYNLSILDPLSGTLSHTTLIVNNAEEDVWSDSYQTNSNAVFAAATSSLLLPDWTWNITTNANGRKWVYISTQNQTIVRDGALLQDAKQYLELCAVRDETAGITWLVTLNMSTRSNSTGPGIGNGTIGAFFWQYSDKQSEPSSPLFSVVLPFDELHQASASSCAFNQQKRLLYVQMNGRPPILHTINIAQQKVVTSVAYPSLQREGQFIGCYAITYSNKQQQLYSYLTDGGGMMPLAVQAVDPLTGNNRTLISSSLNITWVSQQTWDDETASWFLSDSQTGVYQLLTLSPTSGGVTATGRLNGETSIGADNTMVWKAVYAYAPQAAAKSPVTASVRSPVWSRMVELVQAIKRRQ